MLNQMPSSVNAATDYMPQAAVSNPTESAMLCQRRPAQLKVTPQAVIYS